MSALEQLESFMERHSTSWHHRRHDKAQSFLDRFVRQNVAEIDEIAFEDKVVSNRPSIRYVTAF